MLIILLFIYSYPPLCKNLSTVPSLLFYKRPALLVPDFAKQKKSEKEFFLGKKAKSKISIQWCLAASQWRCSANPQRGERRRRAQLLLRQPHSASLHPASRASSCVPEHLCLISVYSMYPLARYVPRHQRSLGEGIFWVWECSKNVSI